jgi:type VI secretion system secreted protein Hcp
MAFDAFIKFDGIEGESSDSKHIGWIEITSCDMEINQTISTTASSAGGAGAERADFSDLSFTKLLDKSSPMLAVACADGTHFNTVTIELCRSGTEKKLH